MGITLTRADICIIFDSDWNPQNDLQAMARCHRIGQTRDVTVYRLVTKDTYEEHLFETSSRKQGLEEALLRGNLASNGGSMSAKEVQRLLQLGAHHSSLMAEKAGESRTSRRRLRAATPCFPKRRDSRRRPRRDDPERDARSAVRLLRRQCMT